MDEPVSQSWEHMSADQLKLYAKEIADLYRHEKLLRQELETKNRELELRVKELSALNSMFQQHLDLRMRTEEGFKRLIDRVYELAEEGNLLLRRTDMSPKKES